MRFLLEDDDVSVLRAHVEVEERLFSGKENQDEARAKISDTLLSELSYDNSKEGGGPGFTREFPLKTSKRFSLEADGLAHSRSRVGNSI